MATGRARPFEDFACSSDVDGTRAPYGAPVRSFVLRLVDDQLRDGRVVGRVHDVGNGTEAVVHGLEELVAFLTHDHTADAPGAPGESGGRPETEEPPPT